MDGHRIPIRRSADKEITRLPQATREAVVRRSRALGEEPRPPGSQKLSGRDGYRIRQGDYRVVYVIEPPDVVLVVKIGHRRDVYRD